MAKTHKQFKRYIEKAKNILIVTHRGPDMDAFCSMLLVKEFLDTYYPQKNIVAKAKQLPSFNIPNMHDITVVKTLDKGDEDLIIIVDAADMSLVCEKGDGLIGTSVETIVIDHHQTNTNKHNVLINEGRSSACEQVIFSFKKILGKKFRMSKEIAELGQYGITADTGRFLYETTTPDTLRLYADLYEFSPIDLEEVTYKVNKFPRESTGVMIELLKRTTIEKDMVYTYVTLDDLKKWEDPVVGQAITFFKNNFLRYIQGVHWGFVVEPSTKEANVWYATFRGTKGYQRVDEIAEELGGGGHMYASGVKLEYSESKTLEQVLYDVFKAIKEYAPNF